MGNEQKMQPGQSGFAFFKNTSGVAVSLKIHSQTNALPTIYRCEPGGLMEGPAAYAPAFARLSEGALVQASPEDVEAYNADQAAKAKAAEQASKPRQPPAKG